MTYSFLSSGFLNWNNSAITELVFQLHFQVICEKIDMLSKQLGRNIDNVHFHTVRWSDLPDRVRTPA